MGSVEPWLMARWKARVEFLLSVMELLFLSLTVEALQLQGKMCQNSLSSGCGGSVWTKISGGKGRSHANILIPLERQLIELQLRRRQFLYNETLQQTFHPVLSKLSKRRQIYVIYPHFEEVRRVVEPWLTTRWKARVRLPIRHNWTVFANSCRWVATRQNVSRLAAIRRG